MCCKDERAYEFELVQVIWRLGGVGQIKALFEASPFDVIVSRFGMKNARFDIPRWPPGYQALRSRTYSALETSLMSRWFSYMLDVADVGTKTKRPDEASKLLPNYKISLKKQWKHFKS